MGIVIPIIIVFVVIVGGMFCFVPLVIILPIVLCIMGKKTANILKLKGKGS